MLCAWSSRPGHAHSLLGAADAAVWGASLNAAWTPAWAHARGAPPTLPLPLTLRLPCLLPCCSESDKERLRFLYEEWAHPYFVSKEEYGRIMEVGGHIRYWQAHRMGARELRLQGLLPRASAPGSFTDGQRQSIGAF